MESRSSMMVAVLGVRAFADEMVMPVSDAPWIAMASMTWSDLTYCNHVEEYSRYNEWKSEDSIWGGDWDGLSLHLTSDEWL